MFCWWRRVTLPSQLPTPIICLYCIVNIRQFMELFHLTFSACLWLWFLDVETYLGQLRPVPDVCSIFCSNVLLLAGKLSHLTAASSLYDILCALRLWSRICDTCRSYWFQHLVALSCCAGARFLGPEGWLHM